MIKPDSGPAKARLRLPATLSHRTNDFSIGINQTGDLRRTDDDYQNSFSKDEVHDSDGVILELGRTNVENHSPKPSINAGLAFTTEFLLKFDHRI